MTTPTFSFVWDFVMGFGKAHLPTNIKVATFSRCRNIKGVPKFWGAPLALGQAHFFFGCNFMMGLGKPNLKSLALAVAKILKGNSKILGSFPSP